MEKLTKKILVRKNFLIRERFQWNCKPGIAVYAWRGAGGGNLYLIFLRVLNRVDEIKPINVNFASQFMHVQEFANICIHSTQSTTFKFEIKTILFTLIYFSNINFIFVTSLE